ncbi:MAG: methylmalonyl Co-A mutase-associated GTPase MeaB [Acidimicrobiaceae bacterium]|nr:methylmalonyl Co-A mutase-associated GTPase MeaB [Acidimicrobiaceae bacterium]
MSIVKDPKSLLEQAVGGNRAALAKLISAIERDGPQTTQVIKTIFGTASTAYLVGITGAPGAGKSTLTDKLIRCYRLRGLEVGVIAVDPSSPYSGGAILGDRIRMGDHASDHGVYIRSMATRGHLGGLSTSVPLAARALAAAGFQDVLIETVGVGQVEVEVAGAADTTVVVINPGWGDSIQANKAGLMEIADLFVINKADREGVRATKRDIEAMLDLAPKGDWRPRVLETVASLDRGTDEVFEAILDHRKFLETSGKLKEIRANRDEEQTMRHLVELAKVDLATFSRGFRATSLDPLSKAEEVFAAWLESKSNQTGNS